MKALCAVRVKLIVRNANFGIAAAALALCVFVATDACPNGFGSRSVLKGAPVNTCSEQVTVARVNRAISRCTFALPKGCISSHTPRDEYLIPTAFAIPEGLGFICKRPVIRWR